MLTAWSLPMLDRLASDRMAETRVLAPVIEVREADGQLFFECDVPGMKEDDLEITLENGVLTIRGERRGRGSFRRSFTLPDVVDGERMTADLADGVLTITVPKQPKAQPRKILIGKK